MAQDRIGVFGGTFDPIHVGHLVAAVNARHAMRLDRVILVVANVPWQKEDRPVSPAEDRLAVVEAAVGDVSGLEASRMELDRGGPSYTADTIEELAKTYQGSELFLIVGWDVAGELATWDRWETIQRLCTLIVVNRPGVGGRPRGLAGDGWRVEEVTVPNLEISSTDLRARAADGRPLDYLIPEAAVHCIRARGLYASHR
jgi:nicotinate-nucleotide adenylyltransferase